MASEIGAECNRTLANGDQIRMESATSCDFAMAMYEKALASTFELYSPDPTVTQIPVTSFDLRSSVTGESYPIRCRVGSDSSTITCENVNDSTVGMSATNTNNRIRQRINILG